MVKHCRLRVKGQRCGVFLHFTDISHQLVSRKSNRELNILNQVETDFKTSLSAKSLDVLLKI